MRDNVISRVTVRCPFCDRLFLMARPLFVDERNRTACPACRAEAVSNTEKMRAGVTPDPGRRR
jgi:endogenous inhibitor of DNA gyrase (YacG/DUF329 family)